MDQEAPEPEKVRRAGNKMIETETEMPGKHSFLVGSSLLKASMKPSWNPRVESLENSMGYLDRGPSENDSVESLRYYSAARSG
jgi:hypothetical protein